MQRKVYFYPGDLKYLYAFPLILSVASYALRHTLKLFSAQTPESFLIAGSKGSSSVLILFALCAVLDRADQSLEPFLSLHFRNIVLSCFFSPLGFLPMSSESPLLTAFNA